MNYKEYKTKNYFNDEFTVLLDIDNIFSIAKTTIVKNYIHLENSTEINFTYAIIINSIKGSETTITGSKDEIDTIYKELSEYLLAKNNTKAKTEKILDQLKPPSSLYRNKQL